MNKNPTTPKQESDQACVRRILEISGPREAVEQQLRYSLRDGEHVPNYCRGLVLKLRTHYSEVATQAEMDPFRRGHFSTYEEPPIDLTREDTYTVLAIPNEDFMTCLKVLRTLRLSCELNGQAGSSMIMTGALDIAKDMAVVNQYNVSPVNEPTLQPVSPLPPAKGN